MKLRLLKKDIISCIILYEKLYIYKYQTLLIYKLCIKFYLLYLEHYNLKHWITFYFIKPTFISFLSYYIYTILLLNILLK